MTSSSSPNISADAADGSTRRRRRRPSAPALVALLVAVVAIVLGLALPLVRAADQGRVEVLTSNAKVQSSQTGQFIQPGQHVCVRRIDVPRAAVGLRVFPSFDSPQAPPLVFTLRDQDGRTVDEETARDYERQQALVVAVDARRPLDDASVCIRNAGASQIVVAHAELPQEGRTRLPFRVDVTTRVFPAAERIPVALTRAALFKSAVVSRPLIAALLVITVVGALAAIVLLVRRARDGRDAA